MKITFRILATMCLVWALLPLLRFVAPNRPPLLDFWCGEAIKDADQILERSGEPKLLDNAPLSVSRKTLILLKETAKSKHPILYQNEADLMFWISSGFALVASISLFSLSAGRTNPGDTNLQEHSLP